MTEDEIRFVCNACPGRRIDERCAFGWPYCWTWERRVKLLSYDYECVTHFTASDGVHELRRPLVFHLVHFPESQHARGVHPTTLGAISCLGAGSWFDHLKPDEDLTAQLEDAVAWRWDNIVLADQATLDSEAHATRQALIDLTRSASPLAKPSISRP